MFSSTKSFMALIHRKLRCDGKYAESCQESKYSESNLTEFFLRETVHSIKKQTKKLTQPHWVTADITTDRRVPSSAPWFHLARWGLTWFGLKGDRFAADAAEIMGVNPHMVLGACHQIRHFYGGLFFHQYMFRRLVVTLETQERGQSHSRRCGLHSITTTYWQRSRHPNALQGDSWEW